MVQHASWTELETEDEHMSTHRRRPGLPSYVRAAIAAVALLVCVVLASGFALATYPGSTNGVLLFGAVVDGNTDIHSVLPNGRALQRLTTQPGFDACPASSPDGKWIAYCSGVAPRYEIWVMRQDGSEKRQVTSLGGASTFPDFSPTGDRIAFAALVPNVTAGADILAVNTDGSGLTALTTTPGDDRYPAYSPDGSRIVFTSFRTGQWQVWLMDADGGNQVQLTFDDVMKDQVLDWSPDGSTIAYVTRPDPLVPGGDIWLMDADGGRQRQLTEGPDLDYGASWSPDGTSIAFLDLGSRNVRILDLASGSRRTVNPFAPQLVPGWQPRGDRTP